MPEPISDIDALEKALTESEKASPEPKKKEPAARKPSTSPRRKGLEDRLEEFFMGIGLIATPFDNFCGPHFGSRAPAMAEAWANLANQNPRVRKALEAILSGGAWGEVVMVTAVTVVPMLRHHNLLPGGRAGEVIDIVEQAENDGHYVDGI